VLNALFPIMSRDRLHARDIRDYQAAARVLMSNTIEFVIRRGKVTPLEWAL
jgi:hypothetical protein